jgi:hypothetical protein
MISASKSEVMLFTRKHERPLVLVRIGSYVLRMDRFLCAMVAMELPCEVCTVKMPPKSKLVEFGGRFSWRAHLSCLILLYRRLIGSVLEYSLVCFTNMAKTHMMGLERAQYWAIIAWVRLVAYYHWRKDSHT